MTKITLYNTATRKKEPFEPLDPANVRMYVCGPTVYDRAHLGNARPAVVFDVLYRLLRHVYGDDHVTYVRNITDIDDKINATALARKNAGAEGTLEELVHERSNQTMAWYLEDMAALGNLNPSHSPRATQYIDEMKAMIEGLIAGGHAYEAEGHVLFRVRSYADYGKLSGRSVDDMIAGARVEVAPFKENPMDFVLWKPSSDDLPGWESPWGPNNGRGRPGWHIECSAMAFELLGSEFDIHAGGNDLTFPHHENEIAQSRCMGHAFARVWMHNEMLQVEGKKMSKSLGNFFSVRELLDQGYPGEVIRFVFLSSHYRKPMDWTEARAREAETTLRKWRDLIGTGARAISSRVPADVERALADDLNTPRAIAVLHKLANAGDIKELVRGAELLGLLSFELDSWYQEPELPKPIVELIEKLIEKRLKAKDIRDYPLSDKIRDVLESVGVTLKDRLGGSDWNYDVFQSSRHIHDRLDHLNKIGNEAAFEVESESLRRDGFRVDTFENIKSADDRLHFVVGRSSTERQRLIGEMNTYLSDYLESLR